MDNTIGQMFAGASQGLEKGITNSYNIDMQGRQERQAIQEYARKSAQENTAFDSKQEETKLRMQQLELQIDTLKKANTKTNTFNALAGYKADSDPSWFNNLLQEDPQFKKLTGDTVRVDKLNLESNEDLKMLTDLGVADPTSPEAKHRYIKAIQPDGSAKIVDTFGFMAATGFTQAMTVQDLDNELKRAHAAYYGSKASGGDGGTADIKNATYMGGLSTKITNGTATAEETAVYDAWLTKQGGSKAAQNKIEGKQAEEVSHLVPPVDPNMGLDLDALKKNSPAAYKATREFITTLETSDAGKKLDTEMAKKLTGGIAGVKGLTETMATLASDENVTTDMVSKYVTQAKTLLPEELRNVTEKDLADIKFRQAYYSVSSVFLKLQSGLTVSDKEREQFEKGLGNLSTNMKTNISGLKGKYESMLSDVTSLRNLKPDLYDYKYSKMAADLKSPLAKMDKVIAPPTVDKQKALNDIWGTK